MDLKEQGFSVEASITTAVALLLLLISPEQPVWRIVILAASALLLLNVVRKSRWVKRSNPILTLTGESFADDDDTVSRKLGAYASVVLVIAVFGIITWPQKPIGIPGDAVLFYGPAESQHRYSPTPKGILPNKPDVRVGSDTKQAAGPVLGAPANGARPSVRPAAPSALTVTFN